MSILIKFTLTFLFVFTTNVSFCIQIRDSLENILPKSERSRANKFVKSLVQSSTGSSKQKYWQEIHNYYLNQKHFEVNTLQSIRAIQYFINRLESRQQDSAKTHEEKKIFIDNCNYLVNETSRKELYASAYDLTQLSNKWKEILVYDSYSWVKINYNHNDFKKAIQTLIIKHYFNRFKESKKLEQQQQIVNDFTRLFPKIVSEGIDPIDYIISSYENEANGVIHLYQHSYFNYYINNIYLYDILLVRNCQDLTIKFSNQDKYVEKLKLRSSFHLEEIQGFLNGSKIYELNLITDDNQQKLESISYFKDGNKIKETHFYFPTDQNEEFKCYSFQFLNNENATLKGIQDTLEYAQELTKKDKIDSAFILIESLKNYNFPDTLAISKSIKATENDITQYRDSVLINRVQISLIEAEILIEEKQYTKAQEKLNEARSACPLGNPIYREIEKIEALLIKKKDFKETD